MRKLATLTLALGLTLLTAHAAHATNYVIHVSGMCSTRWLGDPGGPGGGSNGGTPTLASYSSWTPVEAFVDQTSSLSTAASQFKSYLDTYCTGANSCWIYSYSAGDAVAAYVWDKLAWSYNISGHIVSAGAGGGSTLAGDIARAVTCNFAGSLTESTMRAAYNHQNGWNVGTTSYRLGGNRQMFASNAACVVGTAVHYLTFGLVNGGTCLQSNNDGAVAFHSSGGYNNVGNYSYVWDGTPTNHWSHNASYENSYYGSTGTGTADYLNHYNMKMFGVCLDGGIPGYAGGSAGRAACVSHCQSL